MFAYVGVHIIPIAQLLIRRQNFELKMKLFSVKINAKNDVIAFGATVFFVLVLCFRLTAAIPSLLGMFAYKAFTSMVTKGMFAYKAFTSMVTKNEFSGTLKLFI